MRRILPLALVAALAALPALAQAPQRQPGGFMRGPTTGVLLAAKSVQEDLKLSEEQIKKVNDLSAKQKKAMEEAFKSEALTAAGTSISARPSRTPAATWSCRSGTRRTPSARTSTIP